MNNEFDYMDEILRKENKSGGVFKQQKESYKDFLDFVQKFDSFDSRIISFAPIAEEKKDNTDVPLKLAAMSEELTEQHQSKSEFYHNIEKNIALKIDIRFDNRIFATVIAESDVDLTNGIIFCKETEKYFLSENQNEYYIGTIENFDIKKFNFDLLFPVNKLLLFREENDYLEYVGLPELTSVSLKKEIKGLKVKITQNKGIKTLVFKTNAYKDFINFNDNEVFIPDALLYQKIEILIY